jgi:hypothetical protein
MFRAVSSSRPSVLPVIPAGTDDCEGDGGGEGGERGGNELVTRRRALQDQQDTCPQSRGDAVCSGQIVTAAEAGSGYSDGMWLMPLFLLVTLIYGRTV